MRFNWGADRTPAEWEAAAVAFEEEEAAAAQRRADSWENSDTDGFVSQWAAGLTSQEAGTAANLCRAHGMAEAPALFDLDGNVVSTHRGYKDWAGKTSTYWVLRDRAARVFGKKFVNESSSVKGIDKEIELMEKKGFRIGTIRVRSYPKIVGGGKGLAGAASCRVTVLPSIDRMRADDFEIVDATRPPWYQLMKNTEREAAEYDAARTYTLSADEIRNGQCGNCGRPFPSIETATLHRCKPRD